MPAYELTWKLHALRSLLDVWIASSYLLAMTRSGSGGEAKKKFDEKFSLWDGLTSSGLGGEARPPCGEPIEAALILWHFDLRRNALHSAKPIFDFSSRRKGMK